MSCAKNDSVVSRLEGAEPQRLSFGAPDVVQKTFIDQMQACWFSGSSALLSGFRFDTKAAALETRNGLTELPQITISSDNSGRAQTFVIQFYPFNDNTLISTRNISFPVELAARLKRDVETWVFGRNGCEEAAPAPAASAPVASSTTVQQTAGGWTARAQTP